MRHDNVFLASQELGLVASDAAEILLSIAIVNKSGPAAEIASRLHYVDEELREQELYQITPYAQDLSARALRDLMRICQWRGKGDIEDPSLHATSPRKLRERLMRLFNDRQSREKVETSIAQFCREKVDRIDPFRVRFVELYQTLSVEDYSHNGVAGTANTQYRDPPENDLYPREIHSVLLAGVKDHAMCMQMQHATPMLDRLIDHHWHVTKLCLDSGFRSADQHTRFNIVAASSDMNYWQEIAITIAGNAVQHADSRRKAPASAESESAGHYLKKGDFCKWLEDPCYAKFHLDLDEELRFCKRLPAQELEHIISGCGVRLSALLQRCNLTVEQKVRLSYAIARAFWKFYDSDILGSRWTSEDILFIPLDEEHSSTGAVPLRPFVTLPFTQQCKELQKELEDKDRYTHAFPEILHLGIVLLEIGLGAALGLSYNSRLSPVAHVNTARLKARMRLKDLKNMAWDGFQGKHYFTRTIEVCLESVNFKDQQKEGRKQGQVKDTIYEKVVAPLAWLATVGFGNAEGMPLVSLRKARTSGKTKSNANNDKDYTRLQNKLNSRTSFHTNEPSPEDFLEDFQDVASHIEQNRRNAKVEKRVRVAILDTGCETGLPFFQQSGRSNRLQVWRDFSEAATADPTDDFGHGTFMARLFMHVAPVVDLYLIRVARSTDALEGSKGRIAQAIEHAALDPDWNVDIISMSFGFANNPGEKDNVISDAIDKVLKEREGSVIFFANAGNSWKRGEDFPASHPDVIPIYAADANRNHLNLNPSHVGKGPDKLYTYGTDIPTSITEDIQARFPNTNLSAGTSIATAIAAGVAAMTLTYVSALPELLDCNGIEEVCSKIFTKRGMEQMLHAMSPSIGHQQHFINPIRFWGEKGRAMDVFVTICHIVEKLNKKE